MKANNKTNISLQNKRIFFKKSIEFFIIFFHEVIHEKRPAGKDYQISDIYFLRSSQPSRNSNHKRLARGYFDERVTQHL
jgi:hypothetical protein